VDHMLLPSHATDILNTYAYVPGGGTYHRLLEYLHPDFAHAVLCKHFKRLVGRPARLGQLLPCSDLVKQLS
jgi:hypothetical protein